MKKVLKKKELRLIVNYLYPLPSPLERGDKGGFAALTPLIYSFVFFDTVSPQRFVIFDHNKSNKQKEGF